MPSAYTAILTILQSFLGWRPADAPEPEAPEPQAIADYLAVHPGATPAEVAARLDGWLTAKAAASAALSPAQAKAVLRHRRFKTNVEYWGLNTRVALGLAVEPVFPRSGPIATTVEEWGDNLDAGLDHRGYPLLDDTPEGRKELTQRRLAAKYPLPEWVLAGQEDAYRLLTLAGLLKKWVTPGFTPPAEYLGGDIRAFIGSRPLQILDNLRAAEADLPPKWLEDWRRNPDPEAWS